MTARAIAVSLALILLPLVPLLMAWQRSAHAASSELASSLSRARIEAAIITISFMLLLSGLFWKFIIGPDYSQRRFVTIYGNLGVLLVVCVASFFGARRVKMPLVMASIIVAIEWAYVAVASSVV
jgi:hypothetical protein